MLLITSSALASTNASDSIRGSGTATDLHPAALALCTPAIASSNTKHSDGSTPSCLAASRKPSGAGLPLFTAASSPQTTTGMCLKIRSCLSRFFSTATRRLDVDIAIGTLRSAKISTNSAAPGSASTLRHMSLSWVSHLCQNSDTDGAGGGKSASVAVVRDSPSSAARTFQCLLPYSRTSGIHACPWSPRVCFLSSQGNL
mmetsp:Transcript_11483/g.32544  ORF Transcript_11483/g.32544 Transcript_11483/m.32544 type:complete len:200 (-) Transcript_11483:402-1001(-)